MNSNPKALRTHNKAFGRKDHTIQGVLVIFILRVKYLSPKTLLFGSLDVEGHLLSRDFRRDP